MGKRLEDRAATHADAAAAAHPDAERDARDRVGVAGGAVAREQAVGDGGHQLVAGGRAAAGGGPGRVGDRPRAVAEDREQLHRRCRRRRGLRGGGAGRRRVADRIGKPEHHPLGVTGRLCRRREAGAQPGHRIAGRARDLRRTAREVGRNIVDHQGHRPCGRSGGEQAAGPGRIGLRPGRDLRPARAGGHGQQRAKGGGESDRQRMGRHGFDNSDEIPTFPPAYARPSPLASAQRPMGARMRFGRNAFGGICLLTWSLAGCTGFGPATMRYQQADYAAALADAGKRQTLLNIVRLRYGDVPAFVTRQPDPGRLLAAGHVQRRHRPAHRRQPAPVRRCQGRRRRHVHQQPDRHLCAGDRRRFRPHLPGTDAAGRPVRADAGGRAAGAGSRPRAALDRRLRQRSGHSGRVGGSGRRPSPRCCRCCSSCSAAGRLGVQLGVRSQERVATLRIGAGRAGGHARDAGSAELLELPADRDTFEVVYTLSSASPGQIAIRTRSLIEALSQLAADIDVPAGDIDDGRTYRACHSQAPRPHSRGSSSATGFWSRATHSSRSPMTATGSGSTTATSPPSACSASSCCSCR